MKKDKYTFGSFLTMQPLMLLDKGHSSAIPQNEGKQNESHQKAKDNVANQKGQ